MLELEIYASNKHTQDGIFSYYIYLFSHMQTHSDIILSLAGMCDWQMRLLSVCTVHTCVSVC